MKQAFQKNENITVCDLEVGRYMQVIVRMKVFKYSMSGHILTLAQGHLQRKIKTRFSQTLLGHNEANFLGKL